MEARPVAPSHLHICCHLYLQERMQGCKCLHYLLVRELKNSLKNYQVLHILSTYTFVKKQSRWLVLTSPISCAVFISHIKATTRGQGGCSCSQPIQRTNLMQLAHTENIPHVVSPYLMQLAHTELAHTENILHVVSPYREHTSCSQPIPHVVSPYREQWQHMADQQQNRSRQPKQHQRPVVLVGVQILSSLSIRGAEEGSENPVAPPQLPELCIAEVFNPR